MAILLNPLSNLEVGKFADQQVYPCPAHMHSAQNTKRSIVWFKAASVVPHCAQPFAPFDFRCIAIKKYIFNITDYSWTKCQLYHSKRVGATFPGCATWGIIKCMRSVVVRSKHHGKCMSNDTLTCKQMYRKNRLHCFEVKRTQKNWTVSFKWCEIWLCQSCSSEHPSSNIVVLG